MTVAVEKELIDIVIDCETTGTNPHTCSLLGYSFIKGLNGKVNEPFYMSFEQYCKAHKNNHITKDTINSYRFINHNCKYDKIVLQNHDFGDISFYWDTMVAEYLLHINESVGLKEVFTRRFKEPMKTLVEVYNEATGEKRVNLPEDWYEKVPQSVLADYANRDAENTYKLYLEQVKEFASKPDLYSWFTEIEMPLVNILAEMEIKGVRVDRAGVLKLKDELEKKQGVLKHRLLSIAGNKELNLNSGKQLQEVLYTKFGLPILGKTPKGAPSTDTKVLTKLASRHLFPRVLLEYRTIEKILSTYTQTLVDQLDSNDRLHTNYNQCLTYTRRFSSDSPNLQNIPSKGVGAEIKKCFIPSEGNKFFIYDYDQIELRLLAHFSQDPTLLQAFKNDEDLHQITADLIGKRLGRVFPRANGKTLNFSLIYGKSAYGFSKDWNCSRKEAEEIIAIYFSQYPGVREFMYNQIKKCKLSGGWLKSLAGLPLYVENINSHESNLEEHARRCAVNYVIQGSCADIIKKSIVDIYKRLSYIPVLQIHDELVFDIPYMKNAFDPIEQCMATAFKLDVPITVTSKIADRWEK